MGYTVGIDIGGTKVLGGVVDETGAIISRARRDTPAEGGVALTQAIADVALELMKDSEIESVGVSVAGFISADRKTILATPNIKDWNGVNLDYELTSRIGLPVVIENDANSAAWGEFKFGAGRGKENILMLTVGTGVGGGIVVNSNLHRGSFGIAAEIGHLRIVPNGLLCGCGAYGCFEQYGSGTALLRHAREAIQAHPDRANNILNRGDGSIEGVKGSAITEAARDGDELALSIFEITGDYIGAGIASLAVILDPETVVIGGGVIDAGDILLNPIRTGMEKYMPFAGKHPHPQIVAAQLGNEAGLVGVADLARI
ncbi:glucokinase [Candidatus Planktophila versatilis]|uniref:ROK family glucokinase n=1 Tax=Candidatus Planktophila versatilis TaxID=1884905 RepID=UPI000BAC9F71|nr:ROK family glucokinase [Candidatus Planktophila versatilis]ASY18679.1 glucokinase [Candidatus Planktophila versatilis]